MTAANKSACLLLALFFGFASLGRGEETEEPQPKPRSKNEKMADWGIPQVREINAEISQVWRENQITPSAPATEGEWVRRIYLDVIGRIPSVEELRDYGSNKSAEKKLELVNRLLESDQYTEEYARNWTTIWTNMLIGRNGGLDNNSPINREGMQKYLRDSFARNKPYDRMVKDLITARGATTPGADGFNGATNYLVGKLDDNGAQATAMTAKHFLGLQIQCTQCHNHPFNEWKQQKYWDFNAFFRQTRGLRRFKPGSNELAYVELINQDFAGESGNPGEADLFYELRNGLTKIAFPVFVDGTEVGKSGFVSDVDRRTLLGDMVVQSEFMAKVQVNRTVAHFLGYGFTKPVDDLGPHNQSSHPALLESLAKAFEKASYNQKDLIRWIVLSEPYALSSRMTAQNVSDDPALGETPKFSHFYLRQMGAEELYESLLVASHPGKSRGSYEEQERKKAEWLKQFTLAFGTDEGDESTTFNGTIPQALTMFNGDMVKEAVSAEKGSLVARIAADNKLKPADKINHLFLAGLSRKPNKNEIVAANQLLMARKGDGAAALQDIWWAILNSNEFIMNH